MRGMVLSVCKKVVRIGAGTLKECSTSLTCILGSCRHFNKRNVNGYTIKDISRGAAMN